MGECPRLKNGILTMELAHFFLGALLSAEARFGRRRMRRSNPPFPCGAMDCFAHRAARSADPLARNDGGGVTPTVMPERPEEANPES
jgi:hypothetical protein